MAAVASPEMKAYFEALEAGADVCYELVGRARKAGYDLEDEAEIPRARDLAERVEAQVGPVGIAPRIREVIAKHDRQTAALLVARELAGKLRDELGVEKALEQAVRTSLSILTEGVLVAPTEGWCALRRWRTTTRPAVPPFITPARFAPRGGPRRRFRC